MPSNAKRAINKCLRWNMTVMMAERTIQGKSAIKNRGIALRIYNSTSGLQDQRYKFSFQGERIDLDKFYKI